MNKRTLFLSLFIFCCNFLGYGQSLYDFEWTYLNIKYTGMVVYFNENDIHMRLGFERNGKYHVIHSDYKYTADQEGAFVTLQEINSEFVQDHGDLRSDVFHFMWLNDNNGNMTGPYVIADYALNNNLLDEVEQVSMVELKPSDLTDSYLQQYYFEDEQEYKLLLGTNSQPEYTPPAGQKEVKLHFINVANTAIADIGASTKVDMVNLSGELSGISEVLKMKFHETRISEKEFTKEKLMFEVNKLQVHPNDVVIFYYSGHGFRYSDAVGKYPQLDMRYNSYQKLSKESNVNLNEILNIIKQKGARLTLVLGDCCNNDIGINKQQVGTNFMASRSNVNPNIDKLKILFLQSKGELIAAGASAGEYSWCSAQGGFFTNSLINAIREETSALKTNDIPSWDDIIAHVKISTRKKSDLCSNCKPQNVVYEETIP